MPQNKTISFSDIDNIIEEIDSKKEGYKLRGSKEEIMSSAFAEPFYKMIDFTVFANQRKKNNQFGYSYSNNYAQLDFILKNSTILDFVWGTFSVPDKRSLVERVLQVYKLNFLSVIGGPLYVGSKSKEISLSTALSKIKAASELEVGETTIQLKNFFTLLEDKFPGNDLVLSENIHLDVDKIAVYIINGTFYENVKLDELYDNFIERLKNTSSSNNYHTKANIIQGIEFLRGMNALTSRSSHIIDSEWKRLDKGEGYLERRRSYVESVMKNGMPTPLITNDIASQGFDSLKLLYIENIKPNAVKNESEDILISDISKVMSSIKSLESLGNDGATALKFMLEKKPSITIPLLSSAPNNRLCKNLLKEHFDKV